MKEFIIGFVLGVVQGGILLDYWRDKQDINAMILSDRKKK